MTQMPEVTEIAFVCYAAQDMKRAQNFYEKVLGLMPGYRSETANGIWQEYDIGTGTLSIGKMSGWEPGGQGGTAALEVADFNQAIAHLNTQNVNIVMGPIETPVCFMAMIQDSEGNNLMIHKRKPGHQ